MADSIDKLLQQGLQDRKEDRRIDAKRNLKQAVAMARHSGTRLDLARALTALGQIERDLGDSGAALNRYEEAATIYRTEGAALRLAHTMRHLADIHQDQKHLDLAEPLYQQALNIYRNRTETPPLDLANAIRGIALLKTKTLETEEARQLWQEARDLYAAVGVDAGATESARRLAELAKVTD